MSSQGNEIVLIFEISILFEINIEVEGSVIPFINKLCPDDQILVRNVKHLWDIDVDWRVNDLIIHDISQGIIRKLKDSLLCIQLKTTQSHFKLFLLYYLLEQFLVEFLLFCFQLFRTKSPLISLCRFVLCFF